MRSWLARALVLAIGALAASAGGCATGARALPRYALVARSRAAGDPPPSERGLRALAFAEQQVGHRYCWGGMGPRCFDCSGLASAAWRHAGVRVPRTSSEMADSLLEVAVDDVRAGDILWWPGHVGIYAGGGLVIDALDSRRGVVARLAVDPFRALRPIEDTTRGALP